MAEITERLSTALADRYTLERELGQGGMATVYLAEDLKHKRKVAVKVLRPELAAVLGAERFVQEITTTANLQHPHILPLFDSGEADGFLYYVMPFIDGETLRDKLDREKQLGIDEAVGITTAIADALDYAHRNNVIHRDIKPENILLNEGRPMVADFGIALAVSAAAGGRMTETGLSLGTPHYMSPEQATAEKEITARSDVYSLGSVLYEMLTGEPPHMGTSAQAIIMKIVTEPADPVTKLRKSVPLNVTAAVAKSLEKLAADRFASAAKFAEALVNPAFMLPTTRATAVGVSGTSWRERAALPLAAVAIVLGVVALWGWLQTEPVPMVHRQRIELGDKRLGAVSVFQTAIATDGSAIAYMQGAIGPGNASLLSVGGIWIKERGASSAQLLSGTESALSVSFSPDGDWVLYGTMADLRRVPRRGGASMLVSDSGGFSGGAWLHDGTVVFIGRDFRKIYRVNAQGGETELLMDIEEATAGRALGTVRVTPVWGADAVLIWAGSIAGMDQVWALDLATNEVNPVLTEGAAGAWSLATGHVVYGQSGGGVFVAPFDVGSLELAGPGIPLLDEVTAQLGMLAIVVTPHGTALYRQGGSSSNLLSAAVEPVWVHDGTASPVPTMGEVDFSTNGGISISPDGRQLVYDRFVDDRQDIWIRSLVDSQPPVRLTFGGQFNRRPTWTPDGESVVFGSFRDSDREAVWIRRADGRDQARLLLERDRAIYEALISPDGNWLIYRTDDDGAVGNGDILAVRLDADSAEIEVAVTDEQETSPALSPDGRWLAYARGDDGAKEVYVVPFPNVQDGGPYQVSTGGGNQPVWSKSGDELFYWNAGLVAVEVVTESGFAQRSQRRLFDGGPYLNNPDHRLYQVGSNDREFLFLRPVAATGEDLGSLVLVENWLEEIERRLRGDGFD